MWFSGKSRLIAALNALERTMSLLDTSITNQTNAVAANTAATNALIAALQTTEPTAEQLAAIDANTAQVEANTTAATNAVNPPVVEPEAAS